MITVGEQTGALPQMLNSVAEFFEEDVATALTASLALIEPAILIIMGVVVVFILISLYLPIFSLGQAGGGQGVNHHGQHNTAPLPTLRSTGPGRGRTSGPRLKPWPPLSRRVR